MDSAMFLGALTPTVKDLHNVTSLAQAELVMASKVRATEIPDANATVSMDSLYPALVQCFGIIIVGYLAGRFKLLTNAETKGLATFVGTFALPALIFTSLVDLDWGAVNWTFLLAICISKTIVFFIVILVALLTGRHLDYGRAGLLGIFCTQSNDFAIGYPIVEALYKDIHPEYAAYLYLMAPISLVILNPIGFIMMEISKIKKKKIEIAEQRILSNDTSIPAIENKKGLGDHVMVVLNTLRSLFVNPMIFMTLLGILGGILFPNGLPLIIKSFLVTIGNSFAATALFLTGVKIVGQGNTLRGSGFILPLILILVKILVLPLVCRQTVNIMEAGTNFNETTELSTYAFLYGTFPAAPGAFVIATQYNTEVELIAKSMVLCTFLSAPLMFISAKMISLTNLNPVDFLNELDAFSFDISIAGVVAGFWVLILLMCTKSYKRMPHRITCCLVLSQLMCCTVIIFWKQSGPDVASWILYLQFCIYNIGSYSSWLWTCSLAIVMLFLQCRSLCFVLKLWPYILAFCWGTPTIITILLLVLDDSIITAEKHNPSAHYSTTQTAISVFLLVMSFIVTVGCLVLLQRFRKREKLQIQDVQNNLQSSVSTANLLSHDYVGNARNGSSILRKRNLNANNSSSASSSSACSDADDNNDNSCNNQNNCCNNEHNARSLVRQLSNKTNKKQQRLTNKTQKGNVKVLVDIEDLLQRDRNGISPSSAAAAAAAATTSSATTTATASTTDLIQNNHIHAENDHVSERGGFCNSTFPVCGENAAHCPATILRYEEQVNRNLEPLENTSTDNDEQQSLRHLALLIALLCSMFVSLSVCIWALVMDGMSGIYMEMSFLDAFLNFGQNVIVLAIFISLTGDLFMPVLKYWRFLWYGANILVLPPRSRLSAETEHICEQFCNYHLDNCKKLIAKDRRWRIKVYRQVFYGSEFVNWLIEVGLAKDRVEAVNYARHLVDGRVLCHINNVYHFEDTKLLYRFCNRF